MIVYKRWIRYEELNGKIQYDGWYLFGIIPLYIRKVELK